MIAAQEQESLWRDHRARLFRFVVGRVHDEPTAEDIVHDVLVRAYGKQDTVRDEGKFEQWLYQITRNAVIDHYRARKPTDPLPPNLPEPESEGGREARRELARCLRPFMDSLPDHYREAVELSELQGLTQKETADRLGISLSGAKSRVQRARRMLEGLILECCSVEFDTRGAVVDYHERKGRGGGGGGGGGPADGARPAAGDHRDARPGDRGVQSAGGSCDSGCDAC